MHQLSETLLAAQRDATTVPYVEATLAPQWGGVTQLRWERVYVGQEPDGLHAAIVSAQSGALIRARTQAALNGLFAQRAPSPDPTAQFGSWQSLGATSATGGVAIADIEGRIHVFDVAPNERDIRERSSRDDGVTFGSPRTIATAASAVMSIAAASGPGGSALLLFTDSAGNVRSLRRSGNSWSGPTLWTNSVSAVDGIACAHIDGDWAVVVCGTLADGSSGVWTCALGAGSSQAAGTWSMLREVIASVAGAGVTYRQPSICAVDGARISFVEVYGGAAGYAQTLMTHAPAAARFREHRWREPSPFGQTPGVGPALTASTTHAWLTTPSGAWRARIGAAAFDISDSVIYADAKETPRGASLTLRLAEGPNLDPAITDGSGPLGHELSIAWGYETNGGREAGQTTTLLGAGGAAGDTAG